MFLIKEFIRVRIFGGYCGLNSRKEIWFVFFWFISFEGLYLYNVLEGFYFFFTEGLFLIVLKFYDY